MGVIRRARSVGTRGASGGAGRTPPAAENTKRPDAERGRAAHGKAVRRGVMVAGIVLFLAGGSWSAWVWHDRYELHFGTVHRGVLYRSGQPDGDDLRRLQRNYGIRTVINLRSSGDVREDREALDEVRYARRNGMRFVNLSFNELGPKAVSEAFLKIVRDRANWPVLVHCSAGKERSGVLVAVYRIACQGWTAERAIREMKSYGFKPAKQAEMTRFVRECASR